MPDTELSCPPGSSSCIIIWLSGGLFLRSHTGNNQLVRNTAPSWIVGEGFPLLLNHRERGWWWYREKNKTIMPSSELTNYYNMQTDRLYASIETAKWSTIFFHRRLKIRNGFKITRLLSSQYILSEGYQKCLALLIGGFLGTFIHG